VSSDEEWQGLKHVLHDPRDLEVPLFQSVERRYEHRAQLDATLAPLLRTQDAEELASRLQSAGVPASPLWDAAALVQNEHLAARDFFVERELPGLGSRRGVGLPWRPAAGGPLPLGPTPLVGQHNEEFGIDAITPTRRLPG
jgi:crotonobetainyl-CoA:carnitine CoA-transferase CaiB-like acyl-CoA transferase